MTDNRNKSGEAAAQPGHGDVSAAEVEKFVGGIDFPTDKKGLTEHARNKGAPDEVLTVMERFPEQEYGSVADVAKAIGDAKG